MSNNWKIIFSAAGVLLLVFILSIAGCVSTLNDFVAQEAGVEAQYKQNQNNYANYFNKLKEMAQVPDMYAEQLQKTYNGAISSRYGAGRIRLLFSLSKSTTPILMLLCIGRSCRLLNLEEILLKLIRKHCLTKNGCMRYH